MAGSLVPDPCRPHQPPGYTLRRPEAEQQLRVARRARGSRLNIPCQHARIQELPPVRLYQIEKEFHRQFAVSGRARAQAESRISLPPRPLSARLATHPPRTPTQLPTPAAPLFPLRNAAAAPPAR